MSDDPLDPKPETKEEMIERLADEADVMENALDVIWRELYPTGQSWEYPAQVAAHVLAVLREHKVEHPSPLTPELEKGLPLALRQALGSAREAEHPLATFAKAVLTWVQTSLADVARVEESDDCGPRRLAVVLGDTGFWLSSFGIGSGRRQEAEHYRSGVVNALMEHLGREPKP